MQRATKKFVVAYITLVAFPLLGLLGVVRAGRSLQAPLSIDGTWKLQFEPPSRASGKCGDQLVSSNNLVMSISQSGQNFTMNLSGALSTAVPGSITATDVKAQLQTGDTTVHCGGVTLTASLDPTSNPRAMAGFLSRQGCDSCEPLRFHAVRELPQKAAH